MPCWLMLKLQTSWGADRSRGRCRCRCGRRWDRNATLPVEGPAGADRAVREQQVARWTRATAGMRAGKEEHPRSRCPCRSAWSTRIVAGSTATANTNAPVLPTRERQIEHWSVAGGDCPGGSGSCSWIDTDTECRGGREAGSRRRRSVVLELYGVLPWTETACSRAYDELANWRRWVTVSRERPNRNFVVRAVCRSDYALTRPSIEWSSGKSQRPPYYQMGMVVTSTDPGRTRWPS